MSIAFNQKSVNSAIVFDLDIEALLGGGLVPAAPLDTSFLLTIFTTKAARDKRERTVTMRQLAKIIRKQKADSKEALPLLKGGRFGDDRTPKGSLRSNANMLAVTCIEVDYDLGVVTLADARQRLQKAGIAGLLYESPSSRPDHPKWRGLFPISCERPPSARAGLVAVVNGLFDGELDAASFTASQSFYYGGVGDRTPDVVVVDGRYLDTALELEAGRIFPGGERELGESTGEKTGYTPEVFADAVRAIKNDERFADRTDWLKVGAAICRETNGSEEGFSLFDEWSARHESYDADATRTAWDSIGSPRSTGATVLRFALQDGWIAPTRDRDRDVDSKFDDEPETTGMAFEPISSWGDNPPRQEWLAEGLIPHKNVSSLYGDGGTGKSLLALQLAVAVATGERWIGKAIERPGKVLFLSAEDDRDELHRRAVKICGGTSNLERLLALSLAGEDAILAAPDRKTNALQPTARYKALDAAIAAERPSLVVLDTLADLHSGEQNNTLHGRQFIGLMRRLAMQHDCAVLLLAHPSLTGMSNGSGTGGSVAWNNSVRSRLYLDRVKDKDEEPDTNARVLRTMKANYGATGGEIALRWEKGVFLHQSEEFDEEDLMETMEEKARRVFLKLLDATTRQGQRVSPNLSNTYAPTLFADNPKREGCKKGALLDAMRSLIDDGTIVIEEHGSPSKRSQVLRRCSGE